MSRSAPGDWPETRIVARLPGSLPMGGIIPDTPVHAFATPPARQPATPGPWAWNTLRNAAISTWAD